MESETLEEKIQLTSEKLNEFVEALDEIDTEPLGSVVSDSAHAEELTQLIQVLHDSDNLVCEIAFFTTLSSLVSLGGVKSQKQVGVLLDLAIHAKQQEAVLFDVPHLLFADIIQMCDVEWLLKFWSFFETRADAFVLQQPPKHPFPLVLRATKSKLDDLAANNEPSRDILKSKIIIFVRSMVPKEDRFLSNLSFSQNTLVEKEVSYKSQNDSDPRSHFNTYWRLQRIFMDITGQINGLAGVRYLEEDMEQLLTYFESIEDKNGRDKPRTPVVHVLAAKEYNRDDLSEERRAELTKVYESKHFTPTFMVNKIKFADQARQDISFRQTFYIQCLFLTSFLLDVTSPKISSKLADVKKPGAALPKFVTKFRHNDFKGMRGLHAKAERILKKYHPLLMNAIDTASQEELDFLHDKIDLALKKKPTPADTKSKTFTDATFDEKAQENWAKVMKIPKRTFHKWGTPLISKVFNAKNSMKDLEVTPGAKSEDKVLEQIEHYRSLINEDEGSKELNTWKGLRLARTVLLSKFDQVNQKIGLEGLYDPSLKAAYDVEREKLLAKEREEDERREKEEAERLEEDKRKEEEKKDLEIEKEAKRAEFEKQRLENAASRGCTGIKEDDDEDPDTMERKRKAEEKFQDDKKRVKREQSSRPSSRDITDLY